jgi:Ser/Thr protein kinase RdoA (MazF antagonist)
MLESALIPGSPPHGGGVMAADSLSRLLESYGLAGARLEHVNTSENATFRVVSAGYRAILRLYRIGHRTRAQIEAELDWMQALRAAGVVETPAVVRLPGGGRIGEALTSIGPTPSVLFEELSGAAPPEDQLEYWFGHLGEVCARLHDHAARSDPRIRDRRPVLKWDNLIGPAAIWGSSFEAPCLDARARPVLERASEQIRRRVLEYGQEADRYGLIHGDLRLQNLLVDAGRIHVIDFDDCASCWLPYDLATALSLLEDLPAAPALLAAWVEGYVRRRRLRPADLAIIADLVMMRRLQVLGWLGSRSDSALAMEYAPTYVPATVAAADEYLSGRPRLAPPRS